MAKRVVTFGEIMMRLQPTGFERFTQAKSLQIAYGGGEANVAISLSQFGEDACYVTRLPNNAIGDACVNELRRWGVNTAYIVRGGSRMGLYFYEKGGSQRPSSVIYDRAHSAIAEAQSDDFDWSRIFHGADWFHFTGITPALGEGLSDIVHMAAQAAKNMGLCVSCDLNYRAKLWDISKARVVLRSLMPFVDVLIANEGQAVELFGLSTSTHDAAGGYTSDEECRTICKVLAAQFGFHTVAFTRRESISAQVNGWSARLYTDHSFCLSRRYEMQMIDRVGGGDAFSAGLIHMLINGETPERAVEFATAASCLKHTVEGDFNITSCAEVENLLSGDASGRVQR